MYFSYSPHDITRCITNECFTHNTVDMALEEFFFYTIMPQYFHEIPDCFMGEFLEIPEKSQ